MTHVSGPKKIGAVYRNSLLALSTRNHQAREREEIHTKSLLISFPLLIKPVVKRAPPSWQYFILMTPKMPWFKTSLSYNFLSLDA